MENLKSYLYFLKQNLKLKFLDGELNFLDGVEDPR
jgi:hypothetical protein